MLAQKYRHGCVVVRPFDHHASLCDFHRRYFFSSTSTTNGPIFYHGSYIASKVAAVNAPLATPLDPQRGKPQFLNILSGNSGRALSVPRARLMMCVRRFPLLLLPFVLTWPSRVVGVD